MSVEAGIEIQELIDLDKPLRCEVVWATEKVSQPCGHQASWIGLAHDEVTDHDFTQILLCNRCVTLAKMKSPCECGEIIVKDLRRL